MNNFVQCIGRITIWQAPFPRLELIRAFKEDFLFARPAVPGDAVAGVAGEHHVSPLPLATGAHEDHFVGGNKMVENGSLSHFAGSFAFE